MSISHLINFDQPKAALEVLFPKVLEAREAREARVNELATRIFEDEDLCGVICSQIEIRQNEKQRVLTLLGLHHLPFLNKAFNQAVKKRYQEEVKTTLAFSQDENKALTEGNCFRYLNKFYRKLVENWVACGGVFMATRKGYTLSEMRQKVERRSLYNLYESIWRVHGRALDLQRVKLEDDLEQEITVEDDRHLYEKRHFDNKPDAFKEWASANQAQLKQIEELDLSYGCQICRLPTEIKVFESLKKLSLPFYRTDLHSLPKEILTLNQLRSIHVYPHVFSDTFKASEVFKKLANEKEIIVFEEY